MVLPSFSAITSQMLASGPAAGSAGVAAVTGGLATAVFVFAGGMLFAGGWVFAGGFTSGFLSAGSTTTFARSFSKTVGGFGGGFLRGGAGFLASTGLSFTGGGTFATVVGGLAGCGFGTTSMIVPTELTRTPDSFGSVVATVGSATAFSGANAIKLPPNFIRNDAGSSFGERPSTRNISRSPLRR